MKDRLRTAGRFAAKHLGVSVLIALACAALVFGVWYPYPYGELASGRQLFILLVSVDVVVGPLLSFVVYNPAKPRPELWRDLGIIITIQVAALAYGLHSVAQARPVWLAFEGDLFRVVAMPDIEIADLDRAKPGLNQLSWSGPKLLGVKLLDGSDPDYPKSVMLAAQGVHPAFRPQRWVEFESQRQEVVARARSLELLKQRAPEQASLIESAVSRVDVSAAELGYLPLVAGNQTDWIVVVNKKNGEPIDYLPIDGWP